MVAYMNEKPEIIVYEFERQFGRWFYCRTSVPVTKVDKKALERLELPQTLLGNKVERVNRLDGIKVITESNWLMFRASGTEPIVRIYAEAQSKKEAEKLVSVGRNMLDDL